MMYSSAVIKPQQSLEIHKHDIMFEVFYITSGKAEFIVNDTPFVVYPRDCITIKPGELLSQNNPFEEDVHWTYFGIATD